MKSRKFKAVLAAVSAIAVLATAMTGFAATLSTRTIYNQDADKAIVVSEVSGLSDGTQVTYLVETVPGAGVGGQGIAYIDQKAADSTGKAVFDYQIDKYALSDATRATVTTGNDAGVTGPTGNLNVKAFSAPTGNGYTVTYSDYIAGTEDITACVVADEGYEVTSVTIGDVPQELASSYIVPVTNGIPDELTATVDLKKADVNVTVDPVVGKGSYTPDGESTAKETQTNIFRIDSTMSINDYAFGVVDSNGVKYEATHHPVGQKYVIVEIITKDGSTISTQSYCEKRSATN